MLHLCWLLESCRFYVYAASPQSSGRSQVFVNLTSLSYVLIHSSRAAITSARIRSRPDRPDQFLCGGHDCDDDADDRGLLAAVLVSCLSFVPRARELYFDDRRVRLMMAEGLLLFHRRARGSRELERRKGGAKVARGIQRLAHVHGALSACSARSEMHGLLLGAIMVE